MERKLGPENSDFFRVLAPARETSGSRMQHWSPRLPPFQHPARKLSCAAVFCIMPSVYIKTYGCQMNERDSEAVAVKHVANGSIDEESRRVTTASRST